MTITSLTQKFMLGAALFVLAGLAHAGTCHNEEQPFALQAIEHSNLEIRISEVAALRAHSDSVRYFARAMIDDYARARQELKDLALTLEIPLCEHGLTRRQALQVLALQRHVGVEFDREYLTQQIHHHRQALLLYRKHAVENTDDAMREYAESNSALLQAHLQRAQALAASR